MGRILTADSTRRNVTRARGVIGWFTSFGATAKRRSDGSESRLPSIRSGAVEWTSTVRPSEVVKRAATTALLALMPNGTLATLQKNPGQPSHGVIGNTPGNPEMVKKPLPNGKKGLKNTMTIGSSSTKNCGPGANTEKPGGKNPNLGTPNGDGAKP